jgi:signal transduction histidine kinase
MTKSRDLEHTLKNHLAIILGFSELLLQEAAPDDPRRDDLEEIHKAATAAVEIVSAIGQGDA